jgi:septal ring factor EnvC (AmiA/AmiB activator)
MLMVLSAGLAIAIVGLGFLAYTQYVARAGLDKRVTELEGLMAREIKLNMQAQKEAEEMASDLDLVTRKVGVTTQELERSRKVFADQLREAQERARQEQERLAAQQERSATELTKQIEAKASRTEVAADVNAARQEAARLQQISETKIGAVSGDVRTVASNLEATRKDLDDNRRDLVDVKTTLSQQIARNSTELADLRKKGERDFFEFDIKKDKKVPMQRVADIQIGLESTDVKNRRYDVTIQVDDNRLKKPDRLVNEPIQFLVGRDKLRYELVVNTVDKDRIRGYLSVPKDKVLSAEKPAFR